MLTYNTIATDIAHQFISHIDDTCTQIEICGSIRRKRDLVKDIDIVCIPKNPNALHARLDDLTQNHDQFKQGDKWGNKYKSIIHNTNIGAINIEVYTANPHNLGYIQWLRTGPGQDNQHIMTMLKYHQSIVRFADSYAWHVTYDTNHPNYSTVTEYARIAQLSVPDEKILFKLIGLPYIEPQHRNKISYGRINRQVITPPPEALRQYYSEPPQAQQMRMF